MESGIVTPVVTNNDNGQIDSANRALVWQCFFCMAMFVSTFVCYLMPIIVFARRNRRLQMGDQFTHEDDDLHLPHHWSNAQNASHQLKRYRLKRLLSYCNCISGGVFLGVCFLNLIPCVENEFSSLIKDYPSLKQLVGNFPLGQFTVVWGLFLVLILESVLSRCFSPTNSTQRGDQHSDSISTVPILYLDDDLSELRNENHDEHNCHDDQEELLLGTESNHHPSHQKSNGASEVNNRVNGGETMNRVNEGQHASTVGEHTHGHGHSHLSADMIRHDSMLSFFILMFATSIHSLFEGLALGLQTDISNAIHLFIGIILHECLVALALGLNAVRAQQQNIRLWMHVKFATLFSLTIPVGNILGILLGYTPGHFGRFISAIFQGFAAGTFIHVTFLELIPEELLYCDNNEEEQIYKLLENSDDTNLSETNRENGVHNGVTQPSGEQLESTSTLPSSNGRQEAAHINLVHNHQPVSTSNVNNIKLRKILLLLLGFLIMTLIPFIFNDS